MFLFVGVLVGVTAKSTYLKNTYTNWKNLLSLELRTKKSLKTGMVWYSSSLNYWKWNQGLPMKTFVRLQITENRIFQKIRFFNKKTKWNYFIWNWNYFFLLQNFLLFTKPGITSNFSVSRSTFDNAFSLDKRSN